MLIKDLKDLREYLKTRKALVEDKRPAKANEPTYASGYTKGAEFAFGEALKAVEAALGTEATK